MMLSQVSSQLNTENCVLPRMSKGICGHREEALLMKTLFGFQWKKLAAA